MRMDVRGFDYRERNDEGGWNWLCYLGIAVFTRSSERSITYRWGENELLINYTLVKGDRRYPNNVEEISSILQRWYRCDGCRVRRTWGKGRNLFHGGSHVVAEGCRSKKSLIKKLEKWREQGWFMEQVYRDRVMEAADEVCWTSWETFNLMALLLFLPSVNPTLWWSTLLRKPATVCDNHEQVVVELLDFCDAFALECGIKPEVDFRMKKVNTSLHFILIEDDCILCVGWLQFIKASWIFSACSFYTIRHKRPLLLLVLVSYNNFETVLIATFHFSYLLIHVRDVIRFDTCCWNVALLFGTTTWTCAYHVRDVIIWCYQLTDCQHQLIFCYKWRSLHGYRLSKSLVCVSVQWTAKSECNIVASYSVRHRWHRTCYHEHSAS